MHSGNLANKRIGEISKNKFGSLMRIVEYKNAEDVLVRFIKNGNLVHTQYDNFKKGVVKNVYDKTILNVGCIGEGKHKATVNRKVTQKYEVWDNMIRRCYDEKFHEKHSTYRDCTVCDEWHNFQNFAAWYDENYYSIEEERMHLDKDILIKGNKVYSPDTCIFVPQRINVLFVKNHKTRGNLPIGVSWHKKYKKYRSKCGRTEIIGYYDTHEEAFEAYKTFKENLIKQIANVHKDRIPAKLYNAMLNYQVGITD
jgi:hypothetical protein